MAQSILFSLTHLPRRQPVVRWDAAWACASLKLAKQLRQSEDGQLARVRAILKTDR